uniref:T-box domain-containing protein n=1 Tax=Pseudonaja textilis TaxID=8673 RepID=A0A670ZWR9_PSETE
MVQGSSRLELPRTWRHLWAGIETSREEAGSCPDLVQQVLPAHLPSPLPDPIQTRGPSVAVTLEEPDLWAKFHHAGTEMIITKTGRHWLCTYAKYLMLVDFVPTDNFRYKWNKDQWEIAGKAEPRPPCRTYIHPDSPALGSHWMKEPLSFQKLKLTNNTLDQQGHVILHSMHRYKPRFHVMPADGLFSTRCGVFHSFSFPETVFTSVTAYQNEKITKLKIYNNPFAKGFREHGKNVRHREGGASESPPSPPCRPFLGAPRSFCALAGVAVGSLAKGKAEGCPTARGPPWLSGPSIPPPKIPARGERNSFSPSLRFPAAGEASLPAPSKDSSTFSEFWARPHRLDFPTAPERDPKHHQSLAATPLLPFWQDAGVTGHVEEPAGKPKPQGFSPSAPDQSLSQWVVPPPGDCRARSYAAFSAGSSGSAAGGRSDWSPCALFPYACW